MKGNLKIFNLYEYLLNLNDLILKYLSHDMLIKIYVNIKPIL